MKVSRHCFQQLAVATFTVIAFNANSVSAEIFTDTTVANQSQACSGAAIVDKHREITDPYRTNLCWCDTLKGYVPCDPFPCP